MARLCELASDYLEAAARLRIGLTDARVRLDSLDGGERAAGAQTVALLEKMLRDVREVGDLARHYYEPAYWRDDRYSL